MNSKRSNQRTYGVVLVALSALLWSTAGLFVRMASLDTWTILGWRSLFSVLTLTTFFLLRSRAPRRELSTTLQWPGIVSIVVSVISSIAYILSLRLTTVANVMTIYAALPFIATGIAYFRCGETVSRRFLICCGATLVGIAFMAGAAATARDMAGIIAALVMTSGFAFQLVQSKLHSSMNMSVIISVSALVCLLLAVPLMQHTLPGFIQLLACALYGTLTTGFAYLLVLVGGRYISSGEAAFVSLLDVVLGPIWVWLVYSETPRPITLFGGAIVLISVGWYLLRDLAITHSSPTIKTAGPN